MTEKEFEYYKKTLFSNEERIDRFDYLISPFYGNIRSFYGSWLEANITEMTGKPLDI